MLGFGQTIAMCFGPDFHVLSHVYAPKDHAVKQDQAAVEAGGACGA